MAQKKTPGEMTVREAGRKGGEKVASERGHEFYEEIGKKGGRKVASERGHEFYEEIGRKGGEKVASERGHAFYEEIGHKGGQKVRELIARGKGEGGKSEPVEARGAKSPEVEEEVVGVEEGVDEESIEEEEEEIGASGEEEHAPQP